MSNKRSLFILIAVLSLASLGYALYAQYFQNVAPCPLCIAQRVILVIIAILSLIFAMHNPKNFLIRLYGILIGGFAIFGIKIAARHIWLMHLPPDQQPFSCGMPLDMLYKKIPIHSFIQYILKGDGECGKVNWTIFGMSAPVAVLVLCSVITLIALYIIFAKDKPSDRRFF